MFGIFRKTPRDPNFPKKNDGSFDHRHFGKGPGTRAQKEGWKQGAITRAENRRKKKK